MNLRFIPLLLSALALGCGGSSRTRIEDPRAFHDELFVMDMHLDSVLFTTLYGTDFSVAHDPPEGLDYFFRPQADLPGLVQGGVDAAWLGIVVFPLCQPAKCLSDALNTIQTARRVITDNRPFMELARTTDDVRRIRAEQRFAALIGLEGAHGIGDQPEDVDQLYARGVRYVGMAHFTPNVFAGTNLLAGLPGSGLSDKGRVLVRRMNELGMVVDLAHTHPSTISDLLALTEAPAIVSHTGVRGVYEIFRNLADADMIAIANGGGAIGIFFASQWLSPGNESVVAEVVEHIEHVVTTVGIDHVAIGSDFDGFIKLPEDLREVDDLPRLTEVLVERGFTRSDLRKLYGDNAMRVFEEVEAVAARLQAQGLSRPLPADQ